MIETGAPENKIRMVGRSQVWIYNGGCGYGCEGHRGKVEWHHPISARLDVDCRDEIRSLPARGRLRKGRGIHSGRYRQVLTYHPTNKRRGERTVKRIGESRIVVDQHAVLSPRRKQWTMTC
jgi:hypothetical protein